MRRNLFTSAIIFFIDNYRITYLLMIAILVFGFISIYQIPKESSPEVNIPVIVINTPFPGAGAENVEELITKPIENQISGLSSIERINSTSRQGLSTIIVEFSPSADYSEKINYVRDQVNRVRPNFPRDAGDPLIQRISFSDVPIMNIAISGDYSLSDLNLYAREIKSELEKIPNVSEVNIIGAPEKEIRIFFDDKRLFQYGISPQLIPSILSRENIDFPVGLIETGGGNYNIRTESLLLSSEEIANLPLIYKGGAIIRVGDVADVEDVFSDIGSIARLSTERNIPVSTISIQVFKESGQGDVLSINDLAEEKIASLEDSFPEDLNIETIQSDATMIRDDLFMLSKSILFTITIILIILALFLGIFDALIASIVVPFSFLITFVVIDLFGLTINFLTLFSLVLSLGILVDASIVVTESIFEKKKKGKNNKDASIETIEEFHAPLITGTLTTIFVFIPMLLVSGIIGEFIKSIPITISSVLISSLFVSLVILPTINTRFKGCVKKESKINRYFNYLINIYREKLSFILLRKKFSYSFLGVIFFLFLITSSFPFIGIVSLNMFPSPDSDTIFINLEAPSGTPLREMDEIVKPIEKRLLEDKNISSFITFVGQRAQAGSINVGNTSNPNLAGITILLEEERKEKSTEIVSRYRNLFKDIEGAEVRVTQTEAGPPTEGAIQINITGRDIKKIEDTALLFSEILSEIEGVENIESGISSAPGEFIITLDKDNLRRYNLSSFEIAEYLRMAISGRIATDIKLFDEEIDIIVYSNLKKTDDGIGFSVPVDISEIRNMHIQTERGVVSLENFIDISLTEGRGSINRRDGERIISVRADAEKGFSVPEIINEFRKRTEDISFEEITIGYGGEVDEIQSSFIDLFKSMIVGIIMIFSLMVFQFKSYRQSIFILITIPLASIGVFLGFSIVRQPLSFPGFIGVVALSGIVVNNAIIIIDTINKRYSSSKDIFSSVIDGATSRFRPVILTTITTVFGLIPLIFVGPVWAPVAYSIIFGLIFSTILTLFVIPIIYYKFSKDER